MPSYSPSVPSVQVQTSPGYFTLVKAANTVGYFSLSWLTWKLLTNHLDCQFSTGCVLLSSGWLVLTRIKVDHLLQTYFDILSRIELQLPVVLGVTLSAVALLAKAYHPLFHVAALAEICSWIYIYFLYRRNKARFKKQGYGPVPINTWINPPASVLRAGDLLLTSGNIAKNLHESVGHAEMVLEMPGGQMMLFSSYMNQGARIHPLDEVTGPAYKGHYIGLHLKEAWTKDQRATAVDVAEKMVEDNREWSLQENERVKKRIESLPIPKSWKEKLKDELKVTGYDWFGTFMGRVTVDRWTCIGAALDLYHRMGVKTNHYGTGLLGVGTTLFDPILPVRFLADPAFLLITLDEQKS